MAKDTVSITAADTSAVAQFVIGLPAELRATVIDMFNAGGPTAALDIAMNLLTSDSEDSVFGESSVEDWASGEIYTVTDVKLNASTYDADGSLPVYAVISALDAEGTALTITHGSTNVVAQLINAKHRGWLPVQLLMTERKTRQGYFVNRLVKPAADF